jgi:uncharacterized membrane protein YfcA
MWASEIVILVAATFLLAGTIKGITGLGLPVVSLAILTATIGLREAMALILIPAFAMNVWQAAVGGAISAIARRLWVFMATVSLGIWIGIGLLATGDVVFFSGLLGILLFLYALVSLMTPQIPPPGRWEPWISPVAGMISGVITGLTGAFVMPGGLYLQALGLPKEILVQAMGVSFTIVIIVFGLALSRHDLLTMDLGLLSLFGLAPAAAGMFLGRQVLRRFPEERFRRVFFCVLLLLGLYMAGRSFI